MIQDPVWEQSFPDVASVVVPMLKPGRSTCSSSASRKEVRERQATNEERARATVAQLNGFGLRADRAHERRSKRDLHGLPGMARAETPGDEGCVVIDRRHFAVLAAGVVLVLALLGALAWRVWDPGEGSLAEPIAVNATLSPQQHMFGDPVRARIEVVLDAERVDPDSVKVRANFAPHRQLQPPTESRSAAGPITRVRFDYRLACLTYSCLPNGRRRFELKNAAVEYSTGRGGGVRTEEIDWPTLTASGRISRARFYEAQTRAEFRELEPPAYRVSPRLVEVIGLLLALIFAAAAVILILRLLPLERIAERLGAEDGRHTDPRSSERLRACGTSTPDRAEEGRRALERLAAELRSAGTPSWQARPASSPGHAVPRRRTADEAVRRRRAADLGGR